jgi:isoleucyl-tRNA synthetase
VVAPRKVADSLGAEILRMWVAATDYSSELTINEEILKRVVDGYRRMRNTLRFLLANTADFDPRAHALPVEQWLEVDRYALAMTREMANACIADYQKFEFHLVAQRLQTYCSEDLGGFWLDILKDRLYTAGTNSPARRSAQSALHAATQVLLRLMAPILSFTAEEAWQVLHPQAEPDGPESIFFHTWKDVLPAQADEKPLLARWSRLRELRALVTKKLEESRAAGAIGSSLQAEVTLAAAGDDLALLRSLGDDLKFVLITSAASVREGDAAGEMAIAVTASHHPKCERCWHWRADVGANPRYEGICGRCVANLDGVGEGRRHA